jgi:hypothetical protein
MIATPNIAASALPRLAAVLLVLLACFAISAPAYARRDDPPKPVKPPKTGKLAKTGEIQITTPVVTDPATGQVLFNGIYPLRYDEKDSGFTSPDGILFDNQPPGRHTIEIKMPDGSIWVREILLEAGHRKCVGLTYKNTPKHCWDYPLTANIASVSRDGDIITLTSNVNYSGDIAPTYLWSVSSPNVKFVSGGPSSPEIKISTAEATGKVRVTLGVSVDDGSGNPGCMKEDSKDFDLCNSTPINPSITVSPYFKKGDKVTFTAHVDDSRRLNYAWTTEPYMPFTVNELDHSITVDTTGLAQRTLKAIVIVKEVTDTNDTACPPVEAQKDIEAKFDECTNCTMNDLKARFDDLVIDVQGTPGSKALVYVHGPLMKARAVGAQVQSYLVNTRGLGHNQVHVEPIADSNVIHIEMWAWDSGKPQPQPNLSDELKRPQPSGIQRIPVSTRRPRGRR